MCCERMGMIVIELRTKKWPLFLLSLGFTSDSISLIKFGSEERVSPLKAKSISRTESPRKLMADFYCFLVMETRHIKKGICF